MKNSNYTIGNRSRGFPVCSALPQPLHHRVSRFLEGTGIFCFVNAATLALGPTELASLCTKSPFSWTQIPFSFGPKHSPLLDSNWDPCCVHSTTHTTSFLELTQPLVLDPNSHLLWSERVFSLRLTVGLILHHQQDPNSLFPCAKTAPVTDPNSHLVWTKTVSSL
jgi:hypothetical protein